MASTSPGPHPPTRGALLLQAFLEKHDLTQLAASKALGVSDPTIHDWVAGTKRPRTHHREAIAVWTNGDVPTEAWLRDAERTSMATVQPFVPNVSDSGHSVEDDADASGSHAVSSDVTTPATGTS